MHGILFDLDGVIYNADQPIPGAPTAVAWVKAQAIPHLFVTNTTSQPRRALVEKLGRFGIQTTTERIWTPLAAAKQWLASRPAGGVAAFVQEEAKSELDGLPLLPDDAETGAAYVVIGDLAERWDFATLNRAFRLLHSNPDAVLVALGRTRYWRAPDGISIDVAPFVAALECAAAREAVTLGKPAEAFFQAAAAKLGVPAADLWMIGDDVRADVGGAQQAGLRAALVKTGKFRPEDLETDIRPDLVLESVAELAAALGNK